MTTTEINQLAGWLDRLGSAFSVQQPDTSNHLHDASTQLRELVKDKERLDWLSDKLMLASKSEKELVTFKVTREAIDAAIATQKGSHD